MYLVKRGKYIFQWIITHKANDLQKITLTIPKPVEFQKKTIY